MTRADSSVYEAYVINEDGTQTAIPVGFAQGNTAGYSTARRPGSCNRSGGACAPQNPFTSVGPQTATPRKSLHLGRRLAGLGIAALGVPLLLLPGPGLALIGLGLLMVVMP